MRPNNSNKNSDESGCVYGAFIMASAHLIHYMNVDLVPVGHQPSDQATQLGLWVCLSAAVVHTCHCHLLLLLGLKADTYYAVLINSYICELV